MSEYELIFVIPTYRLRDVCETVATYDENFWNNGHSPRIIVFDDSSVANHEKYYPLLEKTRTWSDVFYVGPKEKEAFSHLLHKRLRDRKLESAVRNLFRPSYGGNRNFALIYTLGSHVVSADDDMRPHGLIEDSPESLGGRRDQPRQAAQDDRERVHTPAVRHPLVVRRRARQEGRRRAGELRQGRARQRHRDGPRDQREPRARARELAAPPEGQGLAQRDRQDGPDLPQRDQRHRRPVLRGAVPRRRGPDQPRTT